MAMETSVLVGHLLAFLPWLSFTVSLHSSHDFCKLLYVVFSSKNQPNGCLITISYLRNVVEKNHPHAWRPAHHLLCMNLIKT
jgi:hypothetical protein